MTDTTALIGLEARERAAQLKKVAEDYQNQVVQKITTNDQYVVCAQRYKDLTASEKELDNLRKTCKQPYARKAEDVDAIFKPLLAAILSVKTQYRMVITTRDQEVETERRRQQEEFNRKAEAKRREEEAKAQALREKEEVARREEEAARRRAEEAANEEDRKAALAEAEKKRKEAEIAANRADIKEAKAENIIAPVAQSLGTSVSGMSARDNWKMAIDDKMGCIAWAIKNNQLGLLDLNPSACNAMAKSVRKETVYDWGKIFNDRGLSTRI